MNPGGDLTAISDLGARGEALDSLISEQRDFFAQRGEAVEWKTQMAVESVLPNGVTVRQVHEPDDFARIAAMESEVWDDDFSWVTQDLRSRVQAAPHEIVVLVAEADGRVISAAWLVFKPGTDFAGLWGGSTLRAWRRHGIYRALVARRAQAAAHRQLSSNLARSFYGDRLPGLPSLTTALANGVAPVLTAVKPLC